MRGLDDFIRAAEKVNLHQMMRSAPACPSIAEFVHPQDPEARSKPGFWKLKEEVVAISRQAITKEVNGLREAPDDEDDEVGCSKAVCKSNIISKLN